MDNLLLRMTEEMWDKIMNVNLKSCFNTVKAVAKTHDETKGGFNYQHDFRGGIERQCRPG